MDGRTISKIQEKDAMATKENDARDPETETSSPRTHAPETANRLQPDALYGQILSERFQLSDKVLGSGSFGHAVLCYDYANTNSDKVPTCIAKVETVPTASCLCPSQTQLEHEYNAYKHLWKHPRIGKYLPEIYAFFTHQLTPEIQVPVMVMERAGLDLLTILEQQNMGYFHLRTLGTIAYQVTHALKYMHSMFLAHRDIKPQNIMLIVDEPTFQIKLIDFGLSMPIPAPDEPNRDAYRSTTCTLAFASWRQHFRHVCSARTDMESFLYTWIFLAGTPIPWGRVPSEEKMDKQTRREMIGHIKHQIEPEELCYVFDDAGRDPYGTNLSDLLRSVRALKFDERPKYSRFLQYFGWLSSPPHS
jgi:serine/threonine protein kinase